jgi:hypothetical protein
MTKANRDRRKIARYIQATLKEAHRADLLNYPVRFDDRLTLAENYYGHRLLLDAPWGSQIVESKK